MAFSVSVENENSPIIFLKHGASNCSAEIYSFGALLNAFVLNKAGVAHNVIDGFTSPQHAKETITAGFKSAKLTPFVCRVAGGKYTYKGEEFLVNKFFLGGEAIHGLLFDAHFNIVEHGADESGAWVTLTYDYNKKDEGFPFEFNTRVTYTLQTGGALTLTTAITNTGDVDMPLADGWHPYFTLGGPVNDLLLQINSHSMLEFSDKLVPTGNFVEHTSFSASKRLGDTFFDNCFVVDDLEKPACTLKNETSGLQLSIVSVTGYPYLQVYTPPHRNSIAVENLSSAPDAFNNGMGLIIAKPREQYNFTAKYILQF